METNFKKDALQKVLDESDEILESFSLVRKDRFNNKVLVVYLVPTALTLANATRFIRNEFFSKIRPGGDSSATSQSALKDSLYPPVQVVLVNAIPRDDAGAVDEASLKAIPVLDAGLIADWSKAIQSQESVERAAVFNALNRREAGYLHRQDVFRSIGWSSQKPDLSPDGKSSKDLQTSDPSVTDVSTVKAEVHANGQLVSDFLDSKYSLNLASTLYRAVDISPEKGIQYIDRAGNRSFQSYPELLELAQTVLTGLQAHGIKAGDKLLLQCDDNREFLAVFWACILGAMIPVPMTIAPSHSKDNAVVQKLLNVWQVFDRPIIVCSDNLVTAFNHLYEETDLSEQQVLFFTQLLNSDPAAVARIEADVAPDALALLLLTSGSTGTPKAVMHTHQTLINRSAATSSFNQFDREDISLNWMPLDHVGGIVMFHLRDVYNACSQVQVATSWILEQPLRWLDTIDSERASITWAPNFAFALIIDQADEISQRNWDLSSMRFILNGGEAVVARTASHFLKLLAKDKLPLNSMKPAWGMSETASAVTFSHNFTVETSSYSDSAVEVGSPIPNTSLRLVDADNHVLCEGEKGNLQIKGASVTPGYYLNTEANQQAFTDDGWFDTGDAGVLKNSCLTITARIKDEIIINGVNYPAAEIEAITETVPGIDVSFTAACAVRRSSSDTDALAIFFCPIDGSFESLKRLLIAIQETVSTNAGVRPEFIVPLSRAQIPKTNIGKIQRSLLKQKFEQGSFDEDVNLSERMLGTNVIPDWFYKKVWRPKTLLGSFPSELQGLDHNNQYLVFCDSVGFAAAFCEKLINSGVQVVMVSIAAEYEPVGENAYTINPNSDSNYAQLMQALQQVDFYPDVIVHCWTYAEVTDLSQLDDFKLAHRQGIYSLINLIQSLVYSNHSKKQIKLFVASCEVQQCLREEKFINPHATIMGLLKTAPYELSWLSARHIDFSSYKTEKELTAQIKALGDEIVSKSPDDEIVYRHGLRYGWHLLPEDFAQDNFCSCPIEAGGVILISGGLGGLGSILAKFLIERFDARLILIGRSKLPERDRWPDLVRQGGKFSERINRYLEIEAMDGEFIYSVADVSNFEDLQRAVSSAERHWKKSLNGVFHLAVGGDIGTGSIVDDSIDSYEQMFTAKVYGSLALAKLVCQRDNAFMASFGSVIGVFGEAGYAAYAAGHTLLNQLTDYFNHKMPGRFHQLDWSAWENNPAFAVDYFKSIGYSLVTAQVGMDSMLAGLCRKQANLIVGLDADKWPIRKHLAFESQSLLKLVGCFTANNKSPDIESSLKTISIYDRFQMLSHCEYLQLEQLPETADGEIDIPALQAMIDNQITAEDDLPSSALEKQIAAFWSDVLDVNEPGKHSNFFQLGGNSLNGMQLISRLNQAFSIHLEMRDLFDAFTISDMAVLIETKQANFEARNRQADFDLEFDQVESLNAHELLANIDQLSEEQVASLLAKMQKEVKA